MLFWKKPIELPEAFYHSIGDCFLDGLQCHALARGLEPLDLRPAQACELLNMVRQSLVNLEAVIARYPLQSDALLQMSDLTTDIQACDEKMKAIAELADPDRSAPLSSCSNIYFLRGILAMETILAIHLEKAIRLMAKGAHMSFGNFRTLALQKVKGTPRSVAIARSLADRAGPADAEIAEIFANAEADVRARSLNPRPIMEAADDGARMHAQFEEFLRKCEAEIEAQTGKEKSLLSVADTADVGGALFVSPILEEKIDEQPEPYNFELKLAMYGYPIPNPSRPFNARWGEVIDRFVSVKNTPEVLVEKADQLAAFAANNIDISMNLYDRQIVDRNEDIFKECIILDQDRARIQLEEAAVLTRIVIERSYCLLGDQGQDKETALWFLDHFRASLAMDLGIKGFPPQEIFHALKANADRYLRFAKWMNEPLKDTLFWEAGKRIGNLFGGCAVHNFFFIREYMKELANRCKAMRMRELLNAQSDGVDAPIAEGGLDGAPMHDFIQDANPQRQHSWVLRSAHAMEEAKKPQGVHKSVLLGAEIRCKLLSVIADVEEEIGVPAVFAVFVASDTRDQEWRGKEHPVRILLSDGTESTMNLPADGTLLCAAFRHFEGRPEKLNFNFWLRYLQARVYELLTGKDHNDISVC
jgi:hypothetical protein